MMKKLCVLLLAAMLFFSCVGVAETVRLSEDSEIFDITLEIPEGAEFLPFVTNGIAMAHVQQEGMAHLFISVAFSELYDGNLADVEESEREALIAAQTKDFGDVTVLPGVTPEGNMYVEFRANSGTDLGVVWTLYQGYFVQLTLYYENGQPLTDADRDFMMELLYGMHFVPAEA